MRIVINQLESCLLVCFLFLVLCCLPGCGGEAKASGAAEIQSLRQQSVDAQASAANWRLMTFAALIMGGIIGMIVGGRDES